MRHRFKSPFVGGDLVLALICGAAVFLGPMGTRTVANAGEAILNCSGLYYDHSNPASVPSTIPPSAAIIDFNNNTFQLAIETLRISKITETTITLEGHAFGKDGQGLNIFGTMDRVSGNATIFWRTPEEERKLLAGQIGTMTATLDLRCVNSQRQF